LFKNLPAKAQFHLLLCEPYFVYTYDEVLQNSDQSLKPQLISAIVVNVLYAHHK